MNPLDSLPVIAESTPRFWPFLLGLLWYVVFCLAQFANLLFPDASAQDTGER